MKNKFKNQRGLSRVAKRSGWFTLIEMLIAISLFIAVVTISIGAILSIFDANKKAQATKTVVDNLNLSIENMTRVVRFGGYYYCDSSASSNKTSWRNCPSGGSHLSVTFGGSSTVSCPSGGSYIGGSRIVYRLSSNAIQRSDDGGSNWVSITSLDTIIDTTNSKFYVFGSDPCDSPSTQPYVIAVIKGYVGTKPTIQSIFSIETLMSQRALDFH